MNSSTFKIIVVFFLAFLTGINFVVFPALGAAFTDSHLFGLSTEQFGNLFIPQVVCIIISSISAPFLVNKFGPKSILAFGILLMLLATGFLWSLQFLIGNQSLLFRLLLILVAFTGFGFGLSITTLNPLAASLFPNQKSSAILILQFLVGLGTSTAPLMMTFVGNVKNWYFVPAIIFIVVSVVFVLFLFLKFEKNNFFELPKKLAIPSRLWIFFFAIVCYGFIEGTFGSFGTIILKHQGLDNTSATLGLSLFWGGIAINRLLFGIFTPHYDLSKIFLVSPLLVGILLFFLPSLKAFEIILLFMFLLGFFMGGIFPGAIGWGTMEFPTISVLVSGVLMAANQVGTGISTNVLGSFSQNISEILKYLALFTIVIFGVFMILQRKSKIKEAF